MIPLIQIVLTMVAFAGVVVALSARGTQMGKAWQKIGIVVLMILMVVAVLNPGLITQLAKFFGVGRGTDLIVYITVVAFIFFALISYLHRQSDRQVLHGLARKLALMEAREKYKEALK